MEELRSDLVAAIPRLRQVAFILAGDEDLAEQAVLQVLLQAEQCADRGSALPCALSWLLAKLLRLPLFNGEGEIGFSPTATFAFSLLEIPLDERICLVLVNGLKFDREVVSRIIREPIEEVDARLLRARQMFECLTGAPTSESSP